MRPSHSITIIIILLSTSILSGCTLLPQPPAQDSRNVGNYALDFLSDDKYISLAIEIDYVSGFAPASESVNMLKQRIGTYLEKPNGVTSTEDSFASSKTSYTLDEIVELEKQHRDQYRTGDTLVLHILYVNGVYAENENVLGITYRADAIIIFKERIETIKIPGWCKRVLGCDLEKADFENSVLVHEFGHILGLVNIGYQSQYDHEDPEYPHHSKYKDSVMYAHVESMKMVDFLSESDQKPPTDFGQYDVKDMVERVAGVV